MDNNPTVGIMEQRVKLGRKQVRVMDIYIDQVTNADVLSIVDSYINSRVPNQIITANVDFCMIARKNTEFREVVNSASLCVADGMPLVWASRLLGAPLPERINGTNLVYALCKEGQSKGYRFFLLGAEESVCTRASEILERDYPGIVIAGHYSPSFGVLSFEENAQIINIIRRTSPDILLVAMGTPKGQNWISDNLEVCRVPVAMVIGGALDFVAGKYRRAPEWMQQHGFEWLFRLCVDFRRLWRRYLLQDMPFLPQIFLQMLRAKRGQL